MILVIFLFCQAMEFRNHGNELKAQLQKKPKTIEKIKIKTKIKYREKKVYINRAKKLDVTKEVEYTKKKFGNNKIALAVFMAESGFDKNEFNDKNKDGSIDRGIAQINSCHCRKIQGNCAEKLFDYKFNIDFAYRLSNGGRDWSPWVAYKNGNYLKYINAF